MSLQAGMATLSQPKGIGIRQSCKLRGVERRDGAGVIEPDVLVELPRQDRLEIVTGALGLRSVDHADRSLKLRLAQALRTGQLGAIAQAQHKARMPGSVAQSLIALRQRRLNLLDLHRPVPVGCRRNGSAIGPEADQVGAAAEFLATQVANIMLAA